MTSAGTEWLLAQVRGSRLRQPADELRELEAARARVQDRGDLEQLAEVDGRLDALFAGVRQSIDDEKREAGAAMRFSSGVRRPLPPPKPSANAQMDAVILRRYQVQRYGRF